MSADTYGLAASNLVAGSNLEQTIQQIMDMGGGKGSSVGWVGKGLTLMVGFLGLGARFESDSEPFLFLGSNRGWVLCFLVKDRGWGSEDEGDIFF